MTASRRMFLKQWAAAPALALSSGARAVAVTAVPGRGPARSSFDPWVEVRTDHLRHNVAQVHRRVGVPHREAAPLLRDLGRRRGVKIEGTMMTFTEDAEFDREQLRRFEALCGGLAAEGVALGRRHAASSFALFQDESAFLDMVRPGMAVYGVYSEPPFRGLGVMDLRPAVALRARVAYVKQLRAGDSAGYNRAYLAKEDVWVATLPVGHADGLPRLAAK